MRIINQTIKNRRLRERSTKKKSVGTKSPYAGGQSFRILTLNAWKRRKRSKSLMGTWTTIERTSKSLEH